MLASTECEVRSFSTGFFLWSKFTLGLLPYGKTVGAMDADVSHSTPPEAFAEEALCDGDRRAASVFAMPCNDRR